MAISYGDLVKRIQTGKIGEADLGAYFQVLRGGANRFEPTFVIREDAVDIAGVEEAARNSANDLVFAALRKSRSAPSRPARSLSSSAAGAAAVLAEGDSWFNLPDFIGVPKTLVDLFPETAPGAFAVRNIAHWGDTLNQMAQSGELVAAARTGRFPVILLSAGGNDALGGGRLSDFLDQRRSGDTDPDNASSYIRPAYFALAEEVERAYLGLLREVSRVAPASRVFIHGYDYAIPRSYGRWLGEPLQFRGFDFFASKKLGRAIVRIMVDDFNNRLKRVALQLARVTYVNLRGTVASNEWWDELHPNKAGASKLSEKMAEAIRAA